MKKALKVLGVLATVGAVIGGVIYFFKKKEMEDDFDDFDDFDDLELDEEEDEELERVYTSIDLGTEEDSEKTEA